MSNTIDGILHKMPNIIYETPPPPKNFDLNKIEQYEEELINTGWIHPKKDMLVIQIMKKECSLIGKQHP